jgi:tetratricopeptide (TPR) repeat protein
MRAAEARLWSAHWLAEAARLAPEIDDLRAAVAWAHEAADATPAGAARALLALRVAAPLVNYAIPSGGWDDARRMTDHALGAAVRAGLAEPAGPDAWAPAPGAAAELRHELALTMYGRAGMALITGDPLGARRSAEAALRIWDAALADPAARAAATHDVPVYRYRALTRIVAAESALAAGDADAAERYAAGALDDGRAAGDGRAHALAAARYGLVLTALGDDARATPLLRESVRYWEAVGDGAFITWTHLTLAAQALRLGDLAAAATHARASLLPHRDQAAPSLVVHGLALVTAVLAAVGSALDGPTATALARLAGAAHGLRTRAGVHLDDAARAAESRATDAAAAVLGGAAVRVAVAAGGRLTAAEAVAEALTAFPPGLLAPSRTAGALAAPAPQHGGPPPADRERPGTHAADPVHDPARDAPLRVHVLGPLRLERAGQSLTGALPAGKATELLLLLVARPEG